MLKINFKTNEPKQKNKNENDPSALAALRLKK